MFSNIRLTLYTPWEDLDYWSRSFLFVFSYNHTEDSKRRGDKTSYHNFKIARNDKVLYIAPQAPFKLIHKPCFVCI